MASRDPRLPPEPELRPVEIRREVPDGFRSAHASSDAHSQEPQVWALYPMAPPAARAEPDGSVDLVRLLQDAARGGRRFLALGALFGFVFGAVYLLAADAIYVVKTVLHVELRKSVIRDSDARLGSSYVGTQAEVIQSPAMIAEAIRAIGLPEADPGLLDRVKAWIRSLDPFGSAPPRDPLEQAVLATLPLLQASPVLGTDVMAVTLRTRAPERGVRFLDALTASYQAYVRENEASAHREGLEVLREREAEIAAQIAELSQRRDREQAETRSLGDGQNELAVQRMSLEEQARARVEAQRRRIDLENELAALREMDDARVAPSREIQDELVRGEAALAELRAKLSARHPDVIQMEQRVEGLREQLRLGAKTRIGELQRALRAAQRTEAALAGLYDREWQKVKALEAESASVKKLAQEIERLEEQRGVVMSLMGEKELAVLAAQSGENSGTLVRVLEAPSLPPSPVWPLPVPVLFGCGLVGLAGGLGFALFSTWRAREGREPELEEPARLADSPFEGPARIAQRRPQEL
jgi:uncharacterized protein involved in exopolysaccharide biosynthesis